VVKTEIVKKKTEKKIAAKQQQPKYEMEEYKNKVRDFF
jgi:hypothetical protein